MFNSQFPTRQEEPTNCWELGHVSDWELGVVLVASAFIQAEVPGLELDVGLGETDPLTGRGRDGSSWS
jgi:hypothetical protein